MRHDRRCILLTTEAERIRSVNAVTQIPINTLRGRRHLHGLSSKKSRIAATFERQRSAASQRQHFGISALLLIVAVRNLVACVH